MKRNAFGKNSERANCLYCNGPELKTQRRQWHLIQQADKEPDHPYPVNSQEKKNVCKLVCFFGLLSFLICTQRDLCLLPKPHKYCSHTLVVLIQAGGQGQPKPLFPLHSRFWLWPLQQRVQLPGRHSPFWALLSKIQIPPKSSLSELDEQAERRVWLRTIKNVNYCPGVQIHIPECSVNF